MTAPPARTVPPAGMAHAVDSATLADVLERILDKGLVIAGDIRIRLVDVELLSIQIRLLVCSVDKAREIGMDWWAPGWHAARGIAPAPADDLQARVARLEAAWQAGPARQPPGAGPAPP